MPPPSDDEIDHLLSRGGLGRQQKERILAGVLASQPVRAPARCRRWWIWAGAGAVSTGLAAVALWLSPVDRAGSDLRAKGASGGAPIVDLVCVDGSIAACPRGGRVAVSLEGGGHDAVFVNAFADPIGGGERIWYLSNQPVAAPPPDGGTAARVVPKAALIADDQPAGRYRVEVVVTRHPVARAELARIPLDTLMARAKFELRVSP